MVRRCGRSGFTLIEMLVIIVIIATLSVVVMPAYNRVYRAKRFDNAVMAVRDLLAFAKERAVATDSNVTVTFNANTQTLLALVTPPTPNKDMPVALTANTNPDSPAPSSGEMGRGARLAEDFTIQDFSVGGRSGERGSTSSRTSGALTFRGDGTCDGAQITVASDYGNVVRVVVWPATGQISVEDADGP